MANPGITVTCNLHPVSPETMVHVPQDHPLVAKTSFLPWMMTAGQQPTAGLPHATLAKLFLPPCMLAPTPDNQPNFEGFNPFTFRLTADAWSRILGEYIDSGLLNAEFESPRDLRLTLQNLTINQPAHLNLELNDISAAETFDAPATAAQDAGGRGRGRGRGAPHPPAQAPTPGPPTLAFLNMCTINLLQVLLLRRSQLRFPVGGLEL